MDDPTEMQKIFSGQSNLWFVHEYPSPLTSGYMTGYMHSRIKVHLHFRLYIDTHFYRRTCRSLLQDELGVTSLDCDEIKSNTPYTNTDPSRSLDHIITRWSMIYAQPLSYSVCKLSRQYMSIPMANLPSRSHRTRRITPLRVWTCFEGRMGRLQRYRRPIAGRFVIEEHSIYPLVYPLIDDWHTCLPAWFGEFCGGWRLRSFPLNDTYTHLLFLSTLAPSLSRSLEFLGNT